VNSSDLLFDGLETMLVAVLIVVGFALDAIREYRQRSKGAERIEKLVGLIEGWAGSEEEDPEDLLKRALASDLETKA
jgi:hypothetical protein